MLIPLGKVTIMQLGKVVLVEGPDNDFFAILISGDIAGKYATEARCLEVLDEIQKLAAQYITTQNGLGVINFAFDYPKVYEMPEK